MLERTVVAQRTLCDSVAYMLEDAENSDPKAIHKLVINKENNLGDAEVLLWGRMRYESYLADIRNETKNEEEKAKTKSRANESTLEQNKVISLEKKSFFG